MKLISITALFLMTALAATAQNSILGYSVVTNFGSGDWFLITSPSEPTNHNVPGNYVASTEQLANGLNLTSNAVIAQFPSTTGLASVNLLTSTSNSLVQPTLFLPITNSAAAPSPAQLTSGASGIWQSNTHLYWSFTADGSTSNSAVLLH